MPGYLIDFCFWNSRMLGLKLLTFRYEFKWHLFFIRLQSGLLLRKLLLVLLLLWYLQTTFLARDLAKALNMLFLLCDPKFSSFSTFYKLLIFFISLLALYYQNNIFFWSYLIRSVLNGSKWIKLDQIWSKFHILQILNHQSACPW